VTLANRDTRTRIARASPILGYWTPSAVKAMQDAVRPGRNGERNALLIRTLFNGALRVSEALADALLAYARKRRLGDGYKFFAISLFQALGIVRKAVRTVGVWVPGTRTHLLRHSGAIERLRQHGNSRALHLHLGHSGPDTTFRYLTTLRVEEAVTINQGVDPERTLPT
jgi:integrase